MESTPTLAAAHALRAVVDRHGDRAAILAADGTQLSYRELWALGERAAKALLALGIAPGERIGSWSPNVLESVVVQLAALRVGAVMVYLDPDWDADAAGAALARAQARAVFVRAFFEGRQYPAMIKTLRGRLEHLRDVVTHGRQPRFERLLPGGWAEFGEAADGVADAALAEREAAVALRPAGDPVAIFAAADGADVALAEAALGHAASLAGDAGPTCASAPFHHPAGLVLGCLGPLLRGAAVALAGPDPDAATIVRILHERGCSSLVVTAKVAATLVEHVAAHPGTRPALARCWIVDGYAADLAAAVRNALGAAAEVRDAAALQLAGRTP